MLLRNILAVATCLSLSTLAQAEPPFNTPFAEHITIKEIGSFTTGGQRVTLSGLPSYEALMVVNGPKRTVDPNGDFWTGQMYVQFIKQAEPKAKYPLLLWHGGGLTGSCWETTPDGRVGWQMFFLKQGYDTYISDAVERGRASWSRYPEVYKTEPVFRPYANAWESFRIGEKYHSDPQKRKAYEGSQYPVESFEASMMAAVPRWSSNNETTQKAYDEYLKKVGPSIIIAHSQGSAFAAQAAFNNPETVKALVFLEPSGMPNLNEEQLKKITHIPQLFVWGDYLDNYPQWNKSIPDKDSYYKTVLTYFKKLEKINPNVTWLELPAIGIKGNTHMLIHDKNNLEIAKIVQDWLAKQNVMK